MMRSVHVFLPVYYDICVHTLVCQIEFGMKLRAVESGARWQPCTTYISAIYETIAKECT